MKKKLLILLCTLFLLAACTTKQGGDTDNDDSLFHEETALLPVEVDILSTGEDFLPGEEGIIEVKVTQGGEGVADADEVLIEIWKKGHQEESINYEAENKGDGLYQLAHTFPEDGIYYVIAHVTARNMHVMPREEFIIGEVELSEHEEEHADHEHHHHTDGEGLSIHLMKPDILKVGEQAQWIVHLAEEDGQPLTEALVRFDYWQDGQAHTLIEAIETVAGEYTAQFAFPKAGEFRVLVHIEKDELHEHHETRVHVE